MGSLVLAQEIGADTQIQQKLKDLVARTPEVARIEQKTPRFSSLEEALQAAQLASDNHDAATALGSTLHACLNYPPDDQFTYNLLDCYRYEQLLQRKAPTTEGADFLAGLAEIANSLPHLSQGYYEIQILRATDLEDAGLDAQAEEIYIRLGAETDLPEAYLGPLALKRGKNEEAMGDYDKALVTYRKVESLVGKQPSAMEAQLQAAFINFDNGNQAEAYRLVELVAQAAQKGSAKPSEQIQNILATIDTTRSQPPAYWEAWHTWWPRWQRIEAAAGLEQPGARKIDPGIPSMAELETKMAQAAASNDSRQGFAFIRQCAYAARFYPDAAIDFIYKLNLMAKFVPSEQDDLRQLGIAVLGPLSPPRPERQGLRLMCLAANLLDSNQNDKVLDLLHREWRPELEDHAAESAAVHKLWALAAIRAHRDLDVIKPLLEKDLNTTVKARHDQTVHILAAVNEALVHPGSAPSAPVVGASGGTATPPSPSSPSPAETAEINALANGVTAWLAANKPPWWDFARSKSPSDPSFQVALNSNNIFLLAEAIKANLQAASSTAYSYPVQSSMASLAYTHLLDLPPLENNMVGVLTGILNTPNLPEAFRKSVIDHFLLAAAACSQSEDFSAIHQKYALEEALDPTQEGGMAGAQQYLEVDKSSNPALLAYALHLLQNPLDEQGRTWLYHTVYFLLRNGDTGSADQIAQTFSKLHATPATVGPLRSLLGLIQGEIAQARQIQLARDALRDAVLKAYPPDTLTKPESFDLQRDGINLDDLSEADATRYRLYLIKMKQDVPTPSFWSAFIQDLPLDAKGYDLKLALFKILLQSAASDASRGSLLMSASDTLSLFNVDQPATQKLMGLLQFYRDNAQFPETNKGIHALDAYLALNGGRFDEYLQKCGDIFGPKTAQLVELASALQQGNGDKIKAALAPLSPEDMESPLLVRNTFQALQVIGDSDRIIPVRRALEDQLYQRVLACWLQPSSQQLNLISLDMAALGTSNDIPEAFSKFIDAHVSRRLRVLEYQMVRASVEGDWNTAITIAGQLTQNYPLEYGGARPYWYLGKGSAELGKTGDAIKALTIFCQYGKAEPQFHEAQVLLAKLSASPK